MNEKWEGLDGSPTEARTIDWAESCLIADSGIIRVGATTMRW